MSCKPTYKGKRYNSLEELYRANGVNEQQKQQAQQLYSKYLNTIFPDSKVKDIVYHYNSSGKKFDKFDKSFIGTQSLGNQDSDQGFSFVDNKLVARAYGSFNTEIYSLSKEVWSTLDENIYNQYDKNIINAIINPQKGDWKSNQDGWSEITIKDPEQIHILGSKQDIEGFKEFVQGKQFQKLTAEEKAKTIEQVTKEHRSITALKDLSAKLAYRIGGKVEFQNHPNADWKGYNQGMTSVLNEAYMTPDTPFHEVLAHPIIRAIKNNIVNSFKIDDNRWEEYKKLKRDIDFLSNHYKLDKDTKQTASDIEILNRLKKSKQITINELGVNDTLFLPQIQKMIDAIENQTSVNEKIVNLFDKLIDNYSDLWKYDNKNIKLLNTKDEIYKNQAKDFLNKNKTSQLYQSLLKELETGRGKEVFEQVKRDYKYKHSKPKYKDAGNKLDVIEISTGNRLTFFSEESKQKALKEEIIGEKYTLEEQQEEAIVTLLGLMAADKLDAKKDASLISKLKELWKQISDFVKSLLRQDGIKIDELPITTTLNDLAEIMAYGNNKIILPGYKIEYSTPLGNKYDTLEEVNNEIRGLADSNVEIDLSDVKIHNNIKNIPNEFTIELPFGDYIIKNENGIWNEYELNNGNVGSIVSKNLPSSAISALYYKDSNGLYNFINKNKEYAQSKEIIEQWKEENNIQYDPEEVYSRGQGFYSSIGAYSNLELDLLLQNLIQHIKDNKKSSGEFTISAFTKPIDKRLKHIEGTGDRVRFVIYPKPEHIKWAAPTDVFSGSVWDAHEKVSKDKKSELLGVSFTKAPALRNINEVSPNLADIIDNLSHFHNELGIELTTNNFRIEYDDNIDYSTKKLIDNVNKILDDKYGKLEKPEIKKEVIESEDVYILRWKNGNVIGRYDSLEAAKKAQVGEYTDSDGNKISAEEVTEIIKGQPIEKIGKQPTQTRENTTSIESVKDKLDSSKGDFLDILTTEEVVGFENENGYLIVDYSDNILPKSLSKKVFKTFEEAKKELEKFTGNISKKEYTSQAETNLKVAALKEVARKYPRSLITSRVVPINPNVTDNSEIQYSKVSSKQDIEGFKTFINERSSVDLTQSKDLQSIIFKENETIGYRERTIKNASADATLALAVDFETAGEKLTKSSVLNQGKKYMPINANNFEVTQERVNKIVDTLNSINKQDSSVADIPQNLVSGIESFGTKQEANSEAKKILGNTPHSIDMIEAGIRTRTTRSVGEIEKYNIKVGDIVKQFGKSADGTTKQILTRVTAIHPKGTPEFLGTWNKEGWTQEGIKAIERYKDGAAAIEFEIVTEHLNSINTEDYKWSRYSDNSYEVSSKGDKRFSAFYAQLNDGRYIEDIYQLDIKGNGVAVSKPLTDRQNPTRSTIKKTGEFKRQVSREQSWNEYKNLWRTYLNENPNLKQDLIEKSKGKVLTDMFASTDVSQARALSEILNEQSKKEISLNITGNGIYTMKGKYTQQQVDEFTYDLLKAVIESPKLKVKINSIRTGGQTGFDEAGAKAGIRLGIPTTILAPKGWVFRDINGRDISNEQAFKERFRILPVIENTIKNTPIPIVENLQSISDNINNLNITDATVQPLVGNSIITPNVTLISVKQQLEFVDYLTNKIASDLILQLKGNSKLRFSSDYLREQLNTYKNIFEQASSLIQTNTLKKQHIQEYLNNWNNIEQAVLNRLKLISGLRIKQNESLLEEDLANDNAEFSTEESLIVKSNYDDGFFLTLDYNNIASTEMRLALYGLTNKNKNFYLTPNDPTSALPIGIETVLNTVHSITADLPGDYNKMKEAMVANLKKYPWLEDLIDRLDNNETLKNEFVRNMHKYTVNMKKIIDKGNGEYSLFNSNSNSVYFVNLQEWNDMFLESKLVRENKEGKYEFNTNSVKGFANFLGVKVTPNRIVVQLDGLLNKVVNDKTITIDEKKNFLNKFLEYFNIYLTNDLIEDIINDKYSVTSTASAPSTFVSLFTGNNSLFGKLIYNVLEGKELDNLYSGNLMKNLIVQNSEIASSSFWSGDKTISGYSYPMYLTEETNALFEKNDNGELVNIKALANLPFSQNNYLIDGLLSGHRAYLESFKYFHLDLAPIEIKGSKDRFSEFQDLSPISQYKIKLTGFWNNGTTIDGQRVALMFYPTMSDKKVPVLFTIPVRDIPSSPIQLANMLYNSLVSPEISRMKAWREALENSTEQGELIPNLEWFNEGTNIFYRIPELNDLSIDFNGEKLDLLIDFPETLTDYNGISLRKKLDNADKGLGSRIKKIVNPVLFEDGSDRQIILQQAIKNRITEVVDREINNQVNQWKSDGLEIKDIPTEYLQYINKKYEITSQDIEGQWYNIAKDFVLNGMMVNADLEALYISDTADYFDKSAYKEISKENINWTNVIKKTEANRAKRLSGDKATRYYGDYTVKPTVNVLYTQDVKALPAALDYYKELGFSDSFIDDNLKANTTDGFALCSIDEHLENLVLAGTISNQERTSILKQYYSGKPLSIDTLNIVLNPLKPVFNGKQLVSNAPWKEHKIFIKYAQVPLLRQFTEGGNLYLDKLRKLVENSQQTTDRSKQIDIISFASTTKVGLPLKGNQVNVLNNSLYQTKDYESNIIPLNRRNFGIQLDKPFDEFKHKITIGTQETSTLFSRIRKIKGFNYKGKIYTGRELEKVYENIYKNIYQRQYNKLVDELFNEDKTQIDINKLGNLIYKEGVARGYSINTLLGLNINKDTNNFDVPLWANPESSKIEALLMAIIKNRIIKLKTTGKGFILQSDIGVWEDKTTEEKSDIVSSMIFTSQWDGNKLKGRHIDPETGEVLGAQILIRSVFEDSFGRTYDIYDYIDKIATKTASGRYIIDLNKLSQAIPKSILEGFGFRIPTQDYSSMSLVEIVGFLPKTHGDAIIAPSDFVSQMGLDFDIDIFYTYLYRTASVFDNELGIPILKRLDELTESDITSIAKTTIQARKSDNLAESILNLFDAALKQEDLEEKLKEEVEEAKLYNELLDIHIAVSKFVGENGKDMSVQNMFSKLLDYGGLEDGSNKEIAAKFQEVRDDKLGLNTFNYLTPQHQGDSYNRANAAKGAVGAFATIKGLFNDIIDKFEEPLQFVSNKDGENQFYLKIDNFETTGYIAANVSKESPLDIINNFLSTSVDDEKLRVLPRLNINDYTIPTIVGLAGLGFNLNQILNVINQDVIFTAIKVLKQKQATSNINSKDPFTIFNVLKEVGYFKDYKSLEDLNIPYFDLTTEDLEKSRNLSEGELYKKVQAKALYTFLQGLKVGNQLFYIRSNTNMNSKGLPSSIIDTTKLADSIEYLKEDKVGKYSEKIINTSQLYDNTLAGYLYNYAVLPAKQWFNDYYPYNSLVVNKTLQNLAFSITGNPINLRESLEEFPGLYERTFKHIKAYINSSKDILGYTNLNTIRKDLITDNKKEINRTINESLTGLVINTSDTYFASENGKLQLSLATIINYLKKTPYYKNNLFLRSLTVRTVKNVALISTNNTTGRKIDPNELFIEFSKLLTDNQNITFKVEAADEDNNISRMDYTINSKELGIKLIQYSFLLNNTLKAKNFEKYLPTSLLKELGIFKGIQEFNWNNYTDINNISTQIIQHNIDLVKSTLSIDNLKDITSGINNENSLFTTVSTIKNGIKEMIYSFEPNINNFKYFYNSPSGEIIFNPYILIKQNKESYLYKYDTGQNKYIFLPTLGNQFLTEYNPNSIGDVTSSIFNNNNPDFNGDITTYTSTQDVILTQEKKDRQTNLSSALDELLQSPALEEYKTIASVISKIADVSNIPVTFKPVVVNSMGQNVFGLYKNGNIYVNNTLDKELLQDTLLHEAVHGTISNIILNPKTTEQQLLKQRLFNVHDLFVDNLSVDLLKKHFKGISEDKLLTLKSVFKKGDTVSLDEFIAYSLSSKNFREVLKDQGLWEKVKLLLKNILKTVGITIKDDVSLNQNLLSLTEKYIFASLDEYMSTIKTTREPFIKQISIQQNETTDLFRLAIENKSTNQIFLQALGLDSFEDLSEEEYQLILNELIKKDPTKNTSEFLGELKNKLCKHG